MLAELDLTAAELSLVFASDARVRRLNRDYRDKDRPTDVLAFAMREGPAAPEDEGLLGDVIISVETARRQARSRRRPLEAELRMLLAHGLLHLVGYDHQTTREERRMKKRTDALCRAALVDMAVQRAALVDVAAPARPPGFKRARKIAL
jgi:probable rRNA maturation factor